MTRDNPVPKGKVNSLMLPQEWVKGGADVVSFAGAKEPSDALATGKSAKRAVVQGTLCEPSAVAATSEERLQSGSPARDFATSRARSMDKRTTELSVRLRKVTIATGYGEKRAF